MFVQWLPLLGISTFFAVGVVLRGWIQYRRYGHTGIVLFQSRDPGRLLRDALFCALFAALIVEAALFALTARSLLLLPTLLLTPTLLPCGAILMGAGIALTAAAQLGMGASWRIGIDERSTPGLVTAGLYQFCRNPIYLGMIASLAGYALMLPTWLSLGAVLGATWCIRAQTLEEEAYLERTYGAAFREYAARVGRFVPGLGKLNYRGM